MNNVIKEIVHIETPTDGFVIANSPNNTRIINIVADRNGVDYKYVTGCEFMLANAWLVHLSEPSTENYTFHIYYVNL